MNDDLDRLASAVSARIQSGQQLERAPSPLYYFFGMFLFLWSFFCLCAAGLVVYGAANDVSPPSFFEMGYWHAADSVGQQTVKDPAPWQVASAQHSRVMLTLELLVGIGIVWAVGSVPLALVMIALK